MGLLGNAVINFYSIVFLSIIFVHSYHQNKRIFLQNRIYRSLILINIVLLILDFISRFDGHPGTYYAVLNQVGNYLIFCLNITLPLFWLLYLYHQIYCSAEKTMKLFWHLLGINILNVVLITVSLPYKWFYYIDQYNIYHRGEFFIFSYTGAIIILIVSSIILIKKKESFEERYYIALNFFVLPPCIGIFLQFFISGVSFMVNCCVISIFILFLYIQNRIIGTDYLTGLYNRKQLDIFLERKINASTPSQKFAGIMLDINNFKLINDVFGHNEGDIALKNTARLLKKCLRSDDFIARFGGDEFCIILDVTDEHELNDIVKRIENEFQSFNYSEKNGYIIACSIGYEIYEHFSEMKSNDFQKRLDILMYQHKQRYHEKIQPEVQTD